LVTIPRGRGYHCRMISCAPCLANWPFGGYCRGAAVRRRRWHLNCAVGVFQRGQCGLASKKVTLVCICVGGFTVETLNADSMFHRQLVNLHPVITVEDSYPSVLATFSLEVALPPSFLPTRQPIGDIAGMCAHQHFTRFGEGQEALQNSLQLHTLGSGRGLGSAKDAIRFTVAQDTRPTAATSNARSLDTQDYLLHTL